MKKFQIRILYRVSGTLQGIVAALLKYRELKHRRLSDDTFKSISYRRNIETFHAFCIAYMSNTFIKLILQSYKKLQIAIYKCNKTEGCTVEIIRYIYMDFKIFHTYFRKQNHKK